MQVSLQSTGTLQITSLIFLCWLFGVSTIENNSLSNENLLLRNLKVSEKQTVLDAICLNTGYCIQLGMGHFPLKPLNGMSYRCNEKMLDTILTFV